MTEVNSKLKKLSKQWAKTKPKTGFAAIEDGSYTGKIVKMEVGEAKNSGRLQVGTRFKILEGPFKGQETTRFDGIEDEQGMSFFKGFAEVIGLDVPDDMEDLPTACEDFAEGCDDVFEFSLVTKNNFQNLYIKGAAGENGAEPSDDAKTIDDFSEGDHVKVTNADGDDFIGEISEMSDKYVVVTDEDGEEHKIFKKKIASVAEHKKGGKKK